jgi:hypothetical protein
MERTFSPVVPGLVFMGLASHAGMGRAVGARDAGGLPAAAVDASLDDPEFSHGKCRDPFTDELQCLAINP